MFATELFLLFVRPLNRSGIRYDIGGKLEHFKISGSERHLREIRRRLNISGGQIDRTELEEWIRVQRVAVEWQRSELKPALNRERHSTGSSCG